MWGIENKKIEIDNAWIDRHAFLSPVIINTIQKLKQREKI